MIVNKFFKLKQGNIDIYSFKVRICDLLDNFKIEYYNAETDEGYQRKPRKRHYIGIAQYLLEDPNIILPSSILGAINPQSITISDTNMKISDALRIVDGQHRIMAFKYIKEFYSDEYKRLSEFELPILLMIINKSNSLQYSYEIGSFISINKKGLKVSTDLASELKRKVLGRGDNELKLSFLSNDELTIAFANEVSVKLATDYFNSVWYKQIRRGDEEKFIKPISINAFSQSILELVGKYIRDRNLDYNNIDKNIYDNYIHELATYLVDAWDVILEKWKKCFSSTELSSYNIQKGIGVYPINKILSDTFNALDLEVSLEKFTELIKASEVLDYYWVKGGKLSMYNSRAGFERVRKIILNQE